MIPRIIHQTWKDENIPDKWAQSPVEWKRHHPDWTYMLWTDVNIREYIEKNHPHLLSLHDSFPHNIQRADMIRYLILYDMGGVYCDLDLYPLGPIDRYLELGAEVYMVYSANANCFTNGLMVSAKGAPVWLDVQRRIAQPIPWWAFGKHLQVMTSTGPIMLTAAFKNTGMTYAVLPKTLFNPYSVTDDFTAAKPGIVLRALPGGSWNAWDSKAYNFALQHKSLGLLLVSSIVACVLATTLYTLALIIVDASPQVYLHRGLHICRICGDYTYCY